MERERLRIEKEAEAVAAEHALAVERERLLRQLVASNAEKQRLAEDVRRLQREMELIRARFEEGHTEADLRAHEQNVAKAAAKLAKNKIWRRSDQDGLLLERLTPIRSGGSWSWRFADWGLHFLGCGLGDEAVTALVALLQPCPNLDGSWEVLPSLMELNLYGNQIGDAGAAAVAGALEPRRNEDGSWTPSTALTALVLGGNNIGDAGAAAMAGALEPRRNGDGSWTPSTALTALVLGANNIGEGAEKALDEAEKAHDSRLPPGMEELTIYI